MLTLRRPAPVEARPNDPLAELLEHSPALRALDAHFDDIFAQEFAQLDYADPAADVPNTDTLTDNLDADTPIAVDVIAPAADFDAELAQLLAEEAPSDATDVTLVPEPATLLQPIIEAPQDTIVSSESFVRPERQVKRNWIGKAAAFIAINAVVLSGYVVSPRTSEDNNAPRDDAVATELALDARAATAATPIMVESEQVLVEPEQFLPKPGDIVGVLKIPAICEEIQVLEYSEQEEVDKLGGTGEHTVEIMNLDPTPTERCENILEHERQVEAETGRRHYTRAERGNAARYQPIAGHMTSIQGEGKYTSALPGEVGHTLIDGHGKTFSAPFSDLNVLKPGDEVIFERDDGLVVTYVVVKQDIVPEGDVASAFNYSHPDSDTTMTLMNCAYADGRTGSSESRGLVRLIKKP